MAVFGLINSVVTKLKRLRNSIAKVYNPINMAPILIGTQQQQLIAISVSLV